MFPKQFDITFLILNILKSFAYVNNNNNNNKCLWLTHRLSDFKPTFFFLLVHLFKWLINFRKQCTIICILLEIVAAYSDKEKMYKAKRCFCLSKLAYFRFLSVPCYLFDNQANVEHGLFIVIKVTIFRCNFLHCLSNHFVLQNRCFTYLPLNL